MEAFFSIIWSDRMRELKSKMDITDMTDEHQVTCLSEEYKDVLEALESSVASPMFDNLRELCSHMSPTGGPRQQLALAENTHKSPISEENTRSPTTLADKNPRPLPPLLKELQKKKYAAVKAYSRNPTPKNKNIMQALNRETKQRIAEFKRTGNNSQEKLLPKREVSDSIDQQQISHFADKDVDDTDSDDKDTDDEDTDSEDTDDEDTDDEDTDDEDTENKDEDVNNDDFDNEDINYGEIDNEHIDNEDINKEDTDHDAIENEDINSKYINETDKENTNNEETKDEYRRRLGDEYKDVINWAEGLCARALSAYAYTAESTSQHPPVSSEKWDLRDDYMSARLKFYMSKMEANFTSEERRQKARFSSEFMDWIRKLEEHLLLMLPSPTVDKCQLQPATTSTSQTLPSDDNAHQSLPCKDTDVEDTDNKDNDNEDTVGEVMDNEDTDNKETTKDAYRRLGEEYKDVIDWAEELRELALHVTSASTSKSLPVSSDAETWTLRDPYMNARLKEYLSKVSLLPPAATEERRRHNSSLADDFVDWMFEFMKNIILLSPTAAATFASLTNTITNQSVPSTDKVNKDTDNEVTNDGDTEDEYLGQATQRSHHTPIENTSQLQPLVEDNSQPPLLSPQIEYARPSTGSDSDPETIADIIECYLRPSHVKETSHPLPSDENSKQPLPVDNTNYEDSDGEDTEDDVDSDDVDTGDEDTDDEKTYDDDTDDEDTEPAPSPTKNSAQILSPVANTRRPLAAAEIASRLPSTGNTNRSPRQNANQFPHPVASTSQSLPLNENASLNSRRPQPPVRDARPLPPALKELQRRKFAALKDYSRFPSPDNKRILKALEQEAKRGIAEFRRMVQRTATIGERFDDFCTKLKVIDVYNRNETNRLAADYKDVLEFYFSQGEGPYLHLSNLLYHESVQREMCFADTRRRPPPAYPSVPPGLQELLRRKRAALMIYRSYRSPENKMILRALEKEVKQGLSEFRRTGN